VLVLGHIWAWQDVGKYMGNFDPFRGGLRPLFSVFWTPFFDFFEFWGGRLGGGRFQRKNGLYVLLPSKGTSTRGPRGGFLTPPSRNDQIPDPPYFWTPQKYPPLLYIYLVLVLGHIWAWQDVGKYMGNFDPFRGGSEDPFFSFLDPVF